MYMNNGKKLLGLWMPMELFIEWQDIKNQIARKDLSYIYSNIDLMREAIKLLREKYPKS